MGLGLGLGLGPGLGLGLGARAGVRVRVRLELDAVVHAQRELCEDGEVDEALPPEGGLHQVGQLPAARGQNAW